LNNQEANEGTESKDLTERASERLKHHVSIAYSLDISKTPEHKSSLYQFGTLLDINERGICFEGSGKFQMHGIISLYLKLSNDSSGIKMLGKIIWTKWLNEERALVGVKFIGTLPPDWVKLVQGD
jgi:hypothetical protein